MTITLKIVAHANEIDVDLISKGSSDVEILQLICALGNLQKELSARLLKSKYGINTRLIKGSENGG